MVHSFIRNSLAFALTFACVAAAHGQAAGRRAPADTTRQQPASSNRPIAAGPLLDAPVSRTAYRLGPGDVVDVAVFGEASMLHTLAVTPEGTLVIPEVGVARVLGLNLDEAQARVRTLIYTFYRDVEVTLTLSQLRSFKVYLVGNVAAAGVRPATSATRVSEVVPVGTEGEPGRMRRNVLLRRASGDSILVDLVRFALLGDLSANPTLSEGDALIVRFVEEMVTVTGRVAFPGSYEYRPGESLAELLRIVNGGRAFPPTAADTIRVSRFNAAGSRDIIAFSVSDALGAEGGAFRLRPFDAIYVPEVANYGKQYVASVRGQVVHPGTYPIRPDTTTVRELIAMAGGFTPRASLVGATLARARLAVAQAPTGDEGAPEAARTPEEQQITAIARGADANFVVVDFQRLFDEGGDPYDQPVRPGDVLTVPERQYDVAVLGAVGRPGLVPYVSGRTVDQYVAQAGWYSRRADWRDAVVLRAGTGSRVQAREVNSLEPGDRIIVPFRERRPFLERLQTTQAVIGMLSGAAVTIATFIALF